MRYAIVICLYVAALCSGRQAVRCAAQQSQIPETGELFEFHSNFWVNLHHVLYVSSRAHGGHASRPTELASLADTVGWGSLAVGERDTWNEALNYYEGIFATLDLSYDSTAIAIKNLLYLNDDEVLVESGLESELESILNSAAPVYRKVWWERHDAANRAWIGAVLPLLHEYGSAISLGVSNAFRMPWSPRQVRVDITPYTGWAGAYATDDPPHIMVASAAENYSGTQGLEMLFHEALHTMEDSLWSARGAARKRTGKRIPYAVIHAVVFYTAGEVTRRVVSGHTPYYVVQRMAERGGRLGQYFPAVERAWQPYLDGEVSLSEAFNRIVATL